ncbi:MAG: Kazal-type serine protease inhibitor domain-containing protein [Bacteroidota bacterium]
MRLFTLSFFIVCLTFTTFSQECFDEELLQIEACPDIFQPVCGCDGITYSNSCYAQQQGGNTSWTDGECPFFYSWCVDLSGLDFGPCDQILGYGYVNGECVAISGCSIEATNGYSYGLYIHPTPEICESACSNVDGCIDPDLPSGLIQCGPTADPVCGCDGETYLNPCVAMHNNGIFSWTPGECPGESGICLDLAGVDFGDCDLVLGYGRIGDVCAAISGCSTIGNDGEDYADFIFETPEECAGACADLEGCIDPDILDLIIECPNKTPTLQDPL